MSGLPPAINMCGIDKMRYVAKLRGNTYHITIGERCVGQLVCSNGVLNGQRPKDFVEEEWEHLCNQIMEALHA